MRAALPCTGPPPAQCTEAPLPVFCAPTPAFSSTLLSFLGCNSLLYTMQTCMESHNAGSVCLMTFAMFNCCLYVNVSLSVCMSDLWHIFCGDVLLDWKQNVNEVIVRLRCGEEVLRVENVDVAFSDTACQVRFPDGREWGCHLHAEIESSCSKVLYKEKGSILQLVMHKKIPLNTWPTLMVGGSAALEPEPCEKSREEENEGQFSTAWSKVHSGSRPEAPSHNSLCFSFHICHALFKCDMLLPCPDAYFIAMNLLMCVHSVCLVKSNMCMFLGPEPMVNLQFVKNDSYEKGTDLMVVNVYLKEICRKTSRVLFREQDFTLIFQTSDANFLRLHPDRGPNTVFKWQVKLRNLIQPEQSSYSFTPSRIDITLRKRRSQRWGGLEAPAPQGAVGGAKVAVPSGTSSLDVSQPGSSQHALPAKEEPRAGEEKPKPPRAPEDAGLDAVVPRSVSEHVPVKQEPVVAAPKPTCMVQPMTHAPPSGGERVEEEEEKKVCLPGFTGLVNLGNTCFMNSVIQSLSNTRELRDYFHDRAFEAEINCNNPLGTGGRLAIGFAVLLRALWKGTHHAFQPSKLKAIVASKASQFTGYAQHDAQEFMAFLLDGLHEDLNRIQNKPYTETVDSDGRQDEVVAEEAWQRHKMRNDSFIVDLFQGQYKSKLVCPVCSKVSITFDPFLYLPVPLPQKQKVLTVFYFAKEPHKKPVKFLVSVSKENSSTEEVLESISRSVRVKPENLRLAEVVKGRFHRLFLPSHYLDTVSSSDMLFCFEVLSKELTKEKVLLLRVHQRLQVPSIPIAKCAACQKPPLSDEEKLKRCTRCYRVGYCNQACQKNHWPNHKSLCRPNFENVGLPFLISVPESRLTYARLTQLLEGYSRYSVNVFRPPFQSGRTSPEASLSHGDQSAVTGAVPEGLGSEKEAQSAGGLGDTQEANCISGPDAETGQASARSVGDVDVLSTPAVTGYQQPSECSSGSASQFYISLQDANNKEQKLEDKGEGVLEMSEDCTLELVWKNNERLKEYVLVRSKELEFDEDPGSASETARAGHFTLEQCLNLFTKPEVLAPEEAWYCPKCQQHREASKQLLLWRLPNVLIIQLKRFSFRSFIWRDKINDMVDFPVRNLDLSKFCIGQKEDVQQPPIYDLYAVINHYGGMIGGHYTAYARLPNDKNSQRSDVGWRLFDDSTVTTVEESQVVTRYAYVLFYRRRNSPVERPPRLLTPLGAESPAAAGAAASQASLIWQELEEEEDWQREDPSREDRGGLVAGHQQDRVSDYSDDDRVRYFILGTLAAVFALLLNFIYTLLSGSHWI
uniref:ubiquitinyl hydrolase 1 n=1 Tax=Electrophorus electricus TaxID=8005 RepID=A0A4W4ES89_ELEEL